MGRSILTIGCIVAAAVPAVAASFYLSPDVPSDLSGSTRLPWEIVRNDSGSHDTVLTLPHGTAVDAVHRMDGGDWLLSVEAPADLGGTTFEPRDVIRFDGSSYSVYFDGAAAGVPAGADVDAVFLEGGDGGDLVVSFDTVTTIGPATFDPADLVRFAGDTFDLRFDASAAAAGVPTSSNVTGADVRAGLTILTFDVPTTLGGATYLPGELVSWDGSTFGSFSADPSWPVGSRIDGLAFLADPGAVTDSLRVDRSAITPGDLTLTWSPSCSNGAEQYGIYEGEIGSWSSHERIDCADDLGDLTEDVTPSSGDRFFVVVPYNANDEGSYGTDSNGSERARGTVTCVETRALAPCP